MALARKFIKGSLIVGGIGALYHGYQSNKKRNIPADSLSVKITINGTDINHMTEKEQEQFRKDIKLAKTQLKHELHEINSELHDAYKDVKKTMNELIKTWRS